MMTYFFDRAENMSASCFRRSICHPVKGQMILKGITNSYEILHFDHTFYCTF